MVLKGLMFNIFYCGRMGWSCKDSLGQIHFGKVWCLERTDSG